LIAGRGHRAPAFLFASVHLLFVSAVVLLLAPFLFFLKSASASVIERRRPVRFVEIDRLPARVIVMLGLP
jgi:hypothetical protein